MLFRQEKKIDGIELIKNQYLPVLSEANLVPNNPDVESALELLKEVLSERIES